jgi:hypothetical protein
MNHASGRLYCFLFTLINFTDKAVIGIAAAPIMQELKLSPANQRVSAASNQPGQVEQRDQGVVERPRLVFVGALCGGYKGETASGVLGGACGEPLKRARVAACTLP